MNRFHTFAGVLLIAGLFLTQLETVNAQAQSQSQNVFMQPSYALQQQRLTLPVLELFRRKQYAGAEFKLQQLVQKYPDWPVHYYNLAAAQARLKRSEQAIQNLKKSIELGFANIGALQKDPDLEVLRDRPDFRALLSRISGKTGVANSEVGKNVPPRAVEQQRAIVDESNTYWDRRTNRLMSSFKFAAPDKYVSIHGGDGRVARLLTKWNLEGKAAGNHGDLYDNRDHGHSRLPKNLFPQLSHIEYGAAARAAGVDLGVNRHLFYNAITFGNSSTGIAGHPAWRSQARLVLTEPGWAARAYADYTNNHLYIFPEHRDHDPGHGDLFPANTPYMIVSQGSSGSDKPFMEAIGAILAAFQPRTKAFLRDKRLVMPAVQMIFRSGLKSVKTADDYLSARAHPSVFDASEIDVEKMIFAAQELTTDEVPPLVRLAVRNEDKPTPGVNYFGPSENDEVLFNTPSAIARIARSTANERRYVLSASGTKELNGRPLRFEWRLLRGDPKKVEIKQLAQNGSDVEVRIKWHEPEDVPFRTDLQSSRVDVAVFAHNGARYSAPGFFSLYFPTGQLRKYDQAGRPIVIDYAPAKFAKRYFDPLMFAQRKWRDRYRYTDDGDLLGWERQSDGSTRHYSRHGARVMNADKLGRPMSGELIRYRISNASKLPRQIQELPLGKFIRYRYQSDTDLLGKAEICPTPAC